MSGGRAFDRLVNFSDGVVAVAVTIMVLPITDIPGPTGDETMLDVIGGHAALLGSYLVTFVVVGVLWRAHHRVLDGLQAYDGTLFWLNLGWLASIALVPWPIAMLEQDPDGQLVQSLQFALVALSSLLLWLISVHASRTKALMREDAAERQSTSRGLVIACVFGAGAVASAVVPWLAWLVLPAFGAVSALWRPGASPRAGSRP